MIAVTAKAKIPLNAKKINLEKWFYHLTPQDYQKSSPSNLDLSFSKDQNGKRIFTNRVSFSGHLLINRYLEVESRPNHLKLISNHSTLLLFRLFPVSIKVSFELSIESLPENQSVLISTSTGYYPPFLELLSKLTLAKHFLQIHQDQETTYFAKDIFVVS